MACWVLDGLPRWLHVDLTPSVYISINEKLPRFHVLFRVIN